MFISTFPLDLGTMFLVCKFQKIIFVCTQKRYQVLWEVISFLEGQDRPFLLEPQKTDPVDQLDRHIAFRWDIYKAPHEWMVKLTRMTTFMISWAKYHRLTIRQEFCFIFHNIGLLFLQKYFTTTEQSKSLLFFSTLFIWQPSFYKPP